MIENDLRLFPEKFRRSSVSDEARAEAKKRVLDSLACFYGAFAGKPARILRGALAEKTQGECGLWGTAQRVPAETAAWANGTAVRALDYNDTYLSKEPCHPSDLLSSLWAACELSGSRRQGRELLDAMILGYETVCRLCDARSLRLRGWDHVNYISIASAVACSYILRLTPEQTGHALALSIVGNNALRQTRVGTISDWKASCAAYAARAGLTGARLAQKGFTGPAEIFSGRHGFFNQVSGQINLPTRPFGPGWKILSTHTKYFPAEHHAQSAIEAAAALSSQLRGRSVRKIVVDSFEASVQIIGSEKEKWRPATRETADHSLPYLVCAALLKGGVNLRQFESRLYLNPRIRSLMKKTAIRSDSRYTSLYPKMLPARVTVILQSGEKLSEEVLRPLGYAGRPMSESQVKEKFDRLVRPLLSASRRVALAKRISNLESVARLNRLAPLMRVV